MNNIWIKASMVESSKALYGQSWAPGIANVNRLHGNCLMLPRGCVVHGDSLAWVEPHGSWACTIVNLYECTGKVADGRCLDDPLESSLIGPSAAKRTVAESKNIETRAVTGPDQGWRERRKKDLVMVRSTP